MRFEWDNNKARANAAKHKVTFEVSVMNEEVTEFPFESARRITAEEVAVAREAVREQFGIEPPLRGRPAKDDSERCQPPHPQGDEACTKTNHLAATEGKTRLPKIPPGVI